MKISFIVPAYNEEKTIGEVISSLSENFGGHELIVVDDASTDGTFRAAEALGPGRLIRHNKNRGYGAALKKGIIEATGDFVLFVDADGQHPPEEIRKVVKELEAHPETDAVITQRVNANSSGLVRAAGKAVIRYVVKKLTGERVSDHNSGLRAFRREKLLPFLFMLPDGFSISTTSLVLSFKEDFGIRWVNIKMDCRSNGKSRVSLGSGLQTLVLVTRLIVIFDPIKFFLPLGLYSALLGCASIAASLATSGTLGKNYIFFFLFGMLTFIVGLLSEQIAMLRREMVMRGTGKK